MLDRRAAEDVATDSVGAGALVDFEGERRGGSPLRGLFLPSKWKGSSSSTPARFFGLATGNAKAAVPAFRGDTGDFSLEGERVTGFGAENTGPGLEKTGGWGGGGS
jgi:hypothetical protein